MADLLHSLRETQTRYIHTYVHFSPVGILSLSLQEDGRDERLAAICDGCETSFTTWDLVSVALQPGSGDATDGIGDYHAP